MFSRAQLSLVEPQRPVGLHAPRIDSALRIAPDRLELFGHVRVAHATDGMRANDRLERIARELAWVAPHVEVVLPVSVRFRLDRVRDAAAALEVADQVSHRAGAPSIRVAVSSSPLASALAVGTDEVLPRILDHVDSLRLLSTTQVDRLGLDAGVRILLAAAKVRSVLDLGLATALPAVTTLEPIRAAAAMAVGRLPLPRTLAAASMTLAEPSEAPTKLVWLAAPLLRRAYARRGRRRGLLVLRVELDSRQQIRFRLVPPMGAARVVTEALAEQAGEELRRVELATPVRALYVDVT